MSYFCRSLSRFSRQKSIEVTIGKVRIGADNPIAVQTMTSTDTLDTQACVDQIARTVEAGADIVRLTAQTIRHAENLKNIKEALHQRGMGDIPLVADIHFRAEAAIVAAQYVEKVRINPGNFGDSKELFQELISTCKKHNTALRIGVNHGSLSARMVDLYGDTPEGMVASAIEYLQRCREEQFDRVVVSMKSSNVRVMVQAYRLLVAKMADEDMHYPLHLGVTEAGNSTQGRIKSAIGIGTLLADGIGDTIRVSLTEAPENEIPVARKLLTNFSAQINGSSEGSLPEVNAALFNPYEYHRRQSRAIEGIGGTNIPIIYSELTEAQRRCVIDISINDILAHKAEEKSINSDSILRLSPIGKENIPLELRTSFLLMAEMGIDNPVIISCHYDLCDNEQLQLNAASDIGPLLIDGYGDGLEITNSHSTPEETDSLCLEILQAARVRMSSADYIACPSCGRTLYDIQQTLEKIKQRTHHLAGVKIGVMGCIVNGPGEMADADYGYVGAAAGRITLYRGKQIIRHNIPQEEAIEQLIELIKADGRWCEPQNR